MQNFEVVLQNNPLLESHENELSQLSESLNFDTWENLKNFKQIFGKKSLKNNINYCNKFHSKTDFLDKHNILTHYTSIKVIHRMDT